MLLRRVKGTLERVSLIQINELSKVYGFGDATTVALDEISLDIKPGEFIAVMGPSGSGKTTLMNILGLLDRPTHGDYKLSGKKVSRMGRIRQARRRRDNIGFIFQSFNLLPKLSVIENVALPLAYKGMTQKRRLKAAERALEQVGLREKEYHLPNQLSGGQLQRVAIARALVNGPNIIIADEPTGNLDSVSARVVMELLSDIHSMGNTVLMVTHNPSLTRYADRILYMLDGSIVYDEATAVGEVPDRVRKAVNSLRRSSDDENLANVSAMIETMPEPAAAQKKPTKPKRKKKHVKAKRKK